MELKEKNNKYEKLKNDMIASKASFEERQKSLKNSNIELNNKYIEANNKYETERKKNQSLSQEIEKNKTDLNNYEKEKQEINAKLIHSEELIKKYKEDLNKIINKMN